MAVGANVRAEDAQSVLRALIEEGVVDYAAGAISFRQAGVAEHLIAARSLRELRDTGEVRSLERMTSKVAERSPAASAELRSSVEDVVRRQGSKARQLVAKHYRTSPAYVGSRLLTLRYELGAGGRTPKRDLDSIYGSLYALAPEDAWNAFFVVVAAANSQPPERTIEVFAVAWDANPSRTDRWKLLAKLGERKLLYREESIVRVLASDDPRDWETLLSSLAQEADRQRLLTRVIQMADRPLVELIGREPQWRQARGLLTLLFDGRSYVRGEVW
ncbi:MAG TPA: hypothetical protein VFY04_11260 [Solirubrobacterales bacterium]|nr:hypothetical protein [Solirubrobacterales bacterium]